MQSDRQLKHPNALPDQFQDQFPFRSNPFSGYEQIHISVKFQWFLCFSILHILNRLHYIAYSLIQPSPLKLVRNAHVTDLYYCRRLAAYHSPVGWLGNAPIWRPVHVLSSPPGPPAGKMLPQSINTKPPRARFAPVRK